MRRVWILLFALAACERGEETLTNTLPPTSRTTPPVEHRIEFAFDARTFCTAAVARKAGFADGVTVRLVDSSARGATYEIADGRSRAMLFAYVHDDETEARERHDATVAQRGAVEGEAARVSGRVSVTARVSGDNAARLATALCEATAP